ncbi:MAG: hypothetical protein QOD66_1503, partial [Solirubrobacteraceae bacterium]|nr:hypothetical protein [Solirubrobacteraceae bacterium]
FALVPIWLAPLRGRRLLTSAGAMLGFSLAMLALVVAIGGTAGLVEMARGLGYQFQRGSPQSLWAALGAQWFQPIGEAAVLALVAGACYRLRRDPALATREGIAALAAAVLLGLQLTANYWAFLYVVWVVPLMALSLLAERESVVVGAVAAPSKLLVPGLVPSARG